MQVGVRFTNVKQSVREHEFPRMYSKGVECKKLWVYATNFTEQHRCNILLPAVIADLIARDIDLKQNSDKLLNLFNYYSLLIK